MKAPTFVLYSLIGILVVSGPAVTAFVPGTDHLARAVISRGTRRISPLFGKEGDNNDDREGTNWIDSVQQGIISRSPPKYIRMVPRKVRGSRQCFELQTAVTTFERRTKDGSYQQVVIHSQLHFGSQEYFDYYNTKEFRGQYDRVLYELLIDQTLMETNNGLRYLRPNPGGGSVLMASQADANTASQYGLQCQVNVVDYSNSQWVHADLTRQEFLLASGQEAADQGNRPLWALASSAPKWPGAEAVSALFRPSTPSTPLNSPVARRLFSNLFLPGNAFAGLLRSIFWVTLPSPELSVLLLDWSSILPRPTGSISQIALPVLECLFTGNIQEARKLVFGQMVTGSQSSSDNEKLIVGKRNDHAMQVLQTSIDRDNCRSSALLYGAMHCRDLQKKLLDIGFVTGKTQWRTAWSVNVPKFGTGSGPDGLVEPFASSSSPAAIAVGLVVLPLYFLVGGLDWISTLHDLAISVEDGNLIDAGLGVILYLIRHVLLYVGLAKFVVEWDGGVNLFGADKQ